MDTNRIDIFVGAAFQPRETHCPEIAAGKPLPQKKAPSHNPLFTSPSRLHFHRSGLSYRARPVGSGGMCCFSDLLKPLRR
jgi:hypothetical protein